MESPSDSAIGGGGAAGPPSRGTKRGSADSSPMDAFDLPDLCHCDFEDSESEDKASDDDGWDGHDEAPLAPSDDDDSSSGGSSDEHGGVGTRSAAVANRSVSEQAAADCGAEEAGLMLSTLSALQSLATSAALPHGARSAAEAVGCTSAASKALPKLCSAIQAWDAARPELETMGLPPLRKLQCCTEQCCLRLLLEQPLEVLRITSTAKTLKLRFEDRANCPGADSAAFAKGKKMRRRGQAADHSTKGRTTGSAARMDRKRQAKAKREWVLERDTFGWFRETRRRERKQFVRLVLPRLVAAGVCRKGMRALLWCSLNFFYHGELQPCTCVVMLVVCRQPHCACS